MTKLDKPEMVSKAQAEKLAVAYNAYNEACQWNASNNSIRVWGRLLLEAQAATGIELATRRWVEHRIETANGDKAA